MYMQCFNCILILLIRNYFQLCEENYMARYNALLHNVIEFSRYRGPIPIRNEKSVKEISLG